MAPRETENNAYVTFWGDKRRALWYVMVFSGVVNGYNVVPALQRCVALKIVVAYRRL